MKFYKIFLIISSLLLLTDVGFILLNHHAARRAFEVSIQQRAIRQRSAFELALKMELDSMLKLATFVAKDEEIQQLFLKGKRALAREGGGSGGEQTRHYREKLFEAVAPAWKQMHDEFHVRQFHFHLGPGSLSFLRVHSREKFGDRMDDLRHIIVDTHRDHQPRVGFETGRVYAGLRGVAPVFARDGRAGGTRTYVGALEVGTSFHRMLDILDREMDIGLAVLLKEAHVHESMWREMIHKVFEKISRHCACVVEASSRPGQINQLLRESQLFPIEIPALLTEVVYLNSRETVKTPYTVVHFPLRDYRGLRDREAEYVGRVMMWSPVEGELAAFNESIRNSLILGIAGFLVMEFLLWGSLRLIIGHTHRQVARRTQALTESENRLRRFVESLNAILWELDLSSGRFTYVSPQAEKILGYPAGQWRDMVFWQQHIHVADRDWAMNYCQDATEQGRDHEFDYRMLTEEGKIVWLHDIVTVHKDGRGKPIRLSGLMVDVSATKATEEALRRSENRLREAERFSRAIIDALASPLCVLDERTTVLMVNQAWRDFARSNPPPPENYGLGTNYLEICEAARGEGEQEAGLFADGLRRVLYGQAPHFTLEYPCPTAAGPRWFQASITRFPEGGPVRLVVVHEDISNCKRSEEQAASANQAKSSFLANMSHELRTPLNAVLGYAQILVQDPQLDQEILDKIIIIQRSGEYLLTLINDILDLSKIEAGHLELNPHEMSLPAFFDEIVHLFRQRAAQKEVLFQYEVHHSSTTAGRAAFPVIVRADEKRLRQVLLNLISNAMKFTSRGHITLQVIYLEAGIRIVVEDSGRGIAVRDLEKIFQPFRQVGEQEQEGTGLGLSICRKLVNLMGGELQVSSVPGQGSRFWFEIPLEVLESSRSRDIGQVRARQFRIVGFRGGHIRIMVVDDVALNRHLIYEFLSPLGFEIIQAENGKDALKKAVETPPDVILMDLRMPVMNGLQAIGPLRAQPGFEKIPIIAMSAGVFNEQREDALRAGYNAFISKPLQLEILLETLGKYCNIEWIEEEIVREAVNNESELSLPGKGEIARLLKVVNSGDILAILDTLHQSLEQAPEPLIPFYRQAIKLAKNFHLSELKNILEDHLQS